MKSEQDKIDEAWVSMMNIMRNTNWAAQRDLWAHFAKVGMLKYNEYIKAGFKHEDAMYLVANGQK